MADETTRDIARRLVQADEQMPGGKLLGPDLGKLNFLNGLAPGSGWTLKRLFDESGRPTAALHDLGEILERSLKEDA